VLQALKKRGIGKSVSEQGLSDAAQRAVNGNPILRLAKSAANLGLNVTRLGSSMQAVYVKG
jgi:hypothetical protein